MVKVGFLDEWGPAAAEAAWLAGLAWLERVAEHGREGQWGRWSQAPAIEYRRVRREIARAIVMLRFAVQVQERENELLRDLTRQLHEEAAAAGEKRRRAQTLPAEKARVLKSRLRREGREATRDELAEAYPHYPWLWEHLEP